MKLFARTYGTGRPLIIMHGLFGMSDNWQHHAKIYADLGFEVHVLDLRNHGQSPHSDAFSYQLMADDLVEYLADNKIEKACIIGHSLGGKVAMIFATQHPQKVEKLIVVDIAPKAYPVHHQQYLDALNAIDFAALKTRTEADSEMAKHIENLAVRQFLLKSLYWTDDKKLALRFNLKAIEENITMVGEALLDGATYNGETLFIRGALSGYIAEDDDALIEKHFPLAEIYTVEKAGHWVHAEAAKEFTDVTSGFLLGLYV